MRGWLAAVLMLVGAANAWAQAPSENVDRARAYFEAGVVAYDQGKYEVALREFQHAHALSHSAALYFNMAACEEHMDHYQAAALLLRQYLIEKPDADDRANVEVRIKALEERDERLHKMVEPEPQMKAAPTTTLPLAPASPPPPPRARPHLTYTWVLLGTTAAVGVAAIGVGAYTVAHHSDLKGGCGSSADGCSASQLSGLKSTAVATDVLIGVAAAAAIATVAFAIVESRRGRGHGESPARVAFRDGMLRF